MYLILFSFAAQLSLSLAAHATPEKVEAILVGTESGQVLDLDWDRYPDQVRAVIRMDNGKELNIPLTQREIDSVENDPSIMNRRRDLHGGNPNDEESNRDDCWYQGYVEEQPDVEIDANLCLKRIGVREGEHSDEVERILRKARWTDSLDKSASDQRGKRERNNRWVRNQEKGRDRDSDPTPEPESEPEPEPAPEQEQEQFDLGKRSGPATMVDMYVRSLRIFFIVASSGYKRMFPTKAGDLEERVLNKKQAEQNLTYVINRANIMLHSINMVLYPLGVHVITDPKDDPLRYNQKGEIDANYLLPAYAQMARNLPENRGKTIDTVHVVVDHINGPNSITAGLARSDYATCRPNSSVSFGSLRILERGMPMEFSEEFWNIYAIMLVHEIGHTLGLKHDDLATCSVRNYIMCPSSNSEGVRTAARFSPNNLKVLRTMSFDPNKDLCMMKPAAPNSWSYKMLKPSTCGNNIVEPGEQCDCGAPPSAYNPHFCAGDRHCNASSCRFLDYDRSQCWQGPCCDVREDDPNNKPKFLPAGSACRENVSLTGYFAIDRDCIDARCTGKSHLCEVRHRDNGVSCDKGRGYCFNGRCKSMEGQCAMAVGITTPRGNFEVTSAVSQECVHWLPRYPTERKEEYEGQGEIFDCDRPDCIHYARYREQMSETEADNVRCNVLMCETRRSFFSFFDARQPYSMLDFQNFSPNVCLHFNSSMKLPDNRMGDYIRVEDGTKCGENKLCMKGKCLNKQLALGSSSRSNNLAASARRRP